MTHDIHFENSIGERNKVGKPKGAKNRPKPDAADPATAGQLKSFVERIERLEESRIEIVADVVDVYTELHGVGFDKKTVRQLVKLRKQDPDKRSEEGALLEIYAAAIGLDL